MYCDKEVRFSCKLWLMALTVLSVFLSSCHPQSIPLATLPLDQPQAADLNLQGIDQYQSGHYEEALQLFDAAKRANAQFPEAYFNAALTLHRLDRHEEAARHFQRAGELAPHNASIVDSTLYRNHLGLSSILERHLSGGYRYQPSPPPSPSSP